ncbi:zincin-like metallopeptidase toxin domain-containing protein [Sorangium sp. So ce296]|uniref:zincin-like metallopeptidase toxin domain-containing protein n=1 Tax=Sorangium sp. So ce296 TaxID=3133296 RepID=UPI003F632770
MGDGAGGAQSGGEGGRTLQASGAQGGQAAGVQGGSGQGGQGRGQPESVMDRLTRYAGYWHLEFGDDGRDGAASGGIPGAFGSINGGAWAQGLFMALTVFDVVLTVLTLGELAALKASLKGAMRATGQAIRRLASAAARGLQAVRAGLVDLASGLVGRIATRRGSGSARAVADAISETGLFGGKLYGERRLEALRRYLNKRGVNLLVGDELLPSRMPGAFRVAPTGRPQLLLRSNPTEYTVWHELSHYLHFRRIGRDAYLVLPRMKGWNAVEQFVFDMLENPSRWRRLNPAEQAHAIEYIEAVGFR